jgi:drug/metabolite transporter (DMT)-like permease
MGVVLEAFKQKKVPGIRKLLAVGVIMTGTLLATNVFDQSVTLDWKGILFGLLGSLCYTATMYSTNHLEIHLPSPTRSLFMILGGLLLILLAFYRFIGPSFSANIFCSWGLVIALFGTILPPLLFTRGMPLVGIGLGAILASIEIPVAVIMANILIGEQVALGQWIGVVLILGSVIGMNMPKSNFFKFK